MHFAQLLGMSDRVTYALGAGGHRAYKYVPYGPIHEVIPYLLRRAQENSGLLGSSNAAARRDRSACLCSRCDCSSCHWRCCRRASPRLPYLHSLESGVGLVLWVVR